MFVRLVHRNGEEKTVMVGVAGFTLQIYWPLAGWYRVYHTSGRVAGAKSWHVHPDDLGRLVPPKKPKKKKGHHDDEPRGPVACGIHTERDQADRAQQ